MELSYNRGENVSTRHLRTSSAMNGSHFIESLAKGVPHLQKPQAIAKAIGSSLQPDGKFLLTVNLLMSLNMQKLNLCQSRSFTQKHPEKNVFSKAIWTKTSGIDLTVLSEKQIFVYDWPTETHPGTLRTYVLELSKWYSGIAKNTQPHGKEQKERKREGRPGRRGTGGQREGDQKKLM